MKPAPFEYERPSSAAAAVGALQRHAGMARVLAGGQSLVPMLAMRLMRPSAVIDINGLEDELAQIDERPGEITLGALVRYSTIETSPLISQRLPLLAQVVKHIGDRQVRNRGTIGGALAQSDPTGELPLACLALGAQVLARSTSGERTIPIEEFFVGSYANTLEPDELIVAVRFALTRAACRFFERGRKHNDFALLSIAALGERDEQERWHGVRLALGGVNDRPVLAHASAQRLEGAHWDAETIAQAAGLALEAIDPPTDVRASAEYRSHLVPIHVRRVLSDLAGVPAHG